MKFKNTLVAITSLALAFSTANAMTISFTAQAGVGVADLDGTALNGSTVQLGIYDGANFVNILGSTLTGAPLDGLFGGSSLFESTSLVGQQPAMRIFDASGTAAVIAYSTSWAFVAGAGDGTDFASAGLDLADVIAVGTTNLTGTGVLLADPTFALTSFNIGGSGNTNPTFGTPSLEIGAVPEPSTYAMIAGALALAAVMIRRRK